MLQKLRVFLLDYGIKSGNFSHTFGVHFSLLISTWKMIKAKINTFPDF